jgi:putative transcriptional regulator
MFNKSFLVSKIVNSLVSHQFNVFLTQGCFDIAARKENLMLIKSMINVDGLDHDQASSLRTISSFLSAYPFVISVKTNREFLNDEIIYSRFQLPVITPEMLSKILDEELIPAIQSARGKHTISIDVNTLREKRKELQLTLEQLAEIVGISKKALYEIEKSRVNPTSETVKKLENVLRIDLKNSYKMKTVEKTYLKPKNDFQNKVSKELSRIGIDNSSVYSAPFEIVGKEKFSLITSLSKNNVKIKKEATVVKKLSSIFSSKAVFVAKKCREQSVEGVPIILESELPEIESSKELDKILDEKQE